MTQKIESPDLPGRFTFRDAPLMIKLGGVAGGL
jgi:hypothetical protein